MCSFFNVCAQSLFFNFISLLFLLSNNNYAHVNDYDSKRNLYMISIWKETKENKAWKNFFSIKFIARACLLFTDRFAAFAASLYLQSLARMASETEMIVNGMWIRIMSSICDKKSHTYASKHSINKL